jgi:hypothetical protein
MDPYYLLTFQLSLLLSIQIQKTYRISTCKEAKRKKQIHPEYSARLNHDMQLQIDCIEWVLEKIDSNKTPNDRLDGLIRKMIKDPAKRKDKAMRRPNTDDLWTKS